MAANDTMRVIAVGDGSRLEVIEAPRPTPGPSQALIKVSTISLNRGEVKTSMTAERGWRPGWDYAGTVLEAAADGSGPAAGTRVVGVAPVAGWAEYLATAGFFVAPLPDQVSFEDAATLPVAGLTADQSLAKGKRAAGERVLITGASGGVGVFAIQLAALAGAEITAAIRNPANEALVRRLGAQNVAIGETLPDGIGPFDLILESVGGRMLTGALKMLAAEATCVLIGSSEGGPSEIDSANMRVGGASIYGFAGGWELPRIAPAVGLGRLAALVAEGKLDTVIERRGRVEEIATVAAELIDRRYVGKAVLTFD